MPPVQSERRLAMAKPVCTYCDTYEGVLLVTNLDDGETQSVCGNDLLMYSLSMASQLSQGMTTEQCEQYGELLDAIKANDIRQARPAGRRRASRATPADPAPEVPGQSEIPSLARVDLPEPCSACGCGTALGDAQKLVCEQCGEVLATADEAS